MGSSSGLHIWFPMAAVPRCEETVDSYSSQGKVSNRDAIPHLEPAVLKSAVLGWPSRWLN
jgi:hypothetical protein